MTFLPCFCMLVNNDWEIHVSCSQWKRLVLPVTWSGRRSYNPCMVRGAVCCSRHRHQASYFMSCLITRLTEHGTRRDISRSILYVRRLHETRDDDTSRSILYVRMLRETRDDISRSILYVRRLHETRDDDISRGILYVRMLHETRDDISASYMLGREMIYYV